jgi:hypothetical protein
MLPDSRARQRRARQRPESQTSVLVVRRFPQPICQLEDATMFKPTNSPTTFCWTIICWGTILRLTQYVSNRSLWFDEATLAQSIVNRSFSGLLKPLDYGQGAPLGFLMLERSAIQALGTSEYALRLWPLLCGITSLLLFYQVAKLSITPKAIPIALGLFAISGPLIYYSSEVKQYSSDVAIALSVLCAAIYYESRKLTPARVALFGFLGMAAIWFSHPSVFVLAGVGMSLALFSFGGRQWARLRSLSIAYSLWALSFAACYSISLRHLNENKGLLNYWSFGFVPTPLVSLMTIEWFISTFFGIFSNPVGLGLSGIAALSFLVGCISVFSNRADKFFIFTSPIVLTFIAAGLRKYPFSGRLLLFIVPVLLLFIAEGAEQIWSRTRDGAPYIGACLIGLLFLDPLLFSTYHLIKPSAADLPPGVAHIREEIKPVLHYVEDHRSEGDTLYVYLGAQPAFRYYAPRFSLTQMNLVLGASGDWENYEKDLDQLRAYKRVWLLFSHMNTSTGIDEEKYFLYLLNKRGTKLDYFKSVGASVYLYDLDELR